MLFVFLKKGGAEKIPLILRFFLTIGDQGDTGS